MGEIGVEQKPAPNVSTTAEGLQIRTDSWQGGQRAAKGNNLTEVPTATSVDYSLSNMARQGTSIGQSPRQEFYDLLLLHSAVLLHTRSCPHRLFHVLPELSEFRTILKKSYGSVPSEDLAAHHSNGAIGVVG